jgi:23S rRNA (uridine2552-2'-O)-methyltransferase
MTRKGPTRPGRGAAASGSRNLKTRVKTARGRKISSTRWLERQLNDPYVAEAKRFGYRSRAAFKLSEIDDRYHILRPGMIIVDLGAAPGGWSQVAADRIGSVEGDGRIIAIDLQEVEPIAGVELFVADFLEPETEVLIIDALGGLRVDLVMSDMAAPSSGHKNTDHMKIMALCESALAFARDVLAPDGVFLAKVLQGGTEHTLLDEIKRDFQTVRHVKPKSSRQDSSELYVLATGFRGA